MIIFLKGSINMHKDQPRIINRMFINNRYQMNIIQGNFKHQEQYILQIHKILICNKDNHNNKNHYKHQYLDHNHKQI